MPSKAAKVWFTIPSHGFRQADGLPLLALLSDDYLAYEIDRDTLSEPSLAEMTQKAIELLSQDPEGFVLMVEGSRIDHAAHSNDPVGALHDLLAFEEALVSALEFARREGNTLVVSLADHETGGMTLGRQIPDGVEPPDLASEVHPTFWRSVRAETVYDWHPHVLRSVTASGDAIASALVDEEASSHDVISRLTQIDDLTAGEVRLIQEGRAGRARLDLVLGEIISHRAAIAWTTSGHTAVDVNLYAYGPGRERLIGNLDNAEVGRTLMDFLEEAEAAGERGG